MKRWSSAVLASLIATTPSSIAYPRIEIVEYPIQRTTQIPDPRNLCTGQKRKPCKSC